MVFEALDRKGEEAVSMDDDILIPTGIVRYEGISAIYIWNHGSS